MNCRRVFFITLLALFIIVTPVYAGDLNFMRGGEKVIFLAKMILIAAAIIGVLMEIFKKGNIFFILILFLLSVFFINVSEPAKMKNLGRGVLNFITAAENIIDGKNKTVPVNAQDYNPVRGTTD